MIRTGDSKYIFTDFANYVALAQLYGTSEDTKPTTGYATGSSFVEVDTGKLFLYDEESGVWSEVSGTGGGEGGDSDFSTAEVEITDAGNGILIAYIDTDAVSAGIFEATTINAILYKGVAIVTELDESDLTINSGSAEYLTPDNNRVVKITGDCSIGVANN